MKKNLYFALLACAFTLAASCASVAHYNEIDADVMEGNFAGGLAKVRAAKEKSYEAKDRVVYYLDEGMLAHFAGAYTESAESLQSAERAISENFTKSVTTEVSSYLVNDNVLEYAGEDYEDVYLNAFNALNYFHSGSTDGALVEIRRVDNKLKGIATKYGTATTNAQKASLDKSSEIPYDKEAMTSRFTNSALARYLSMLFYRSEGRFDDARIDRDQVKLAFANQPFVYSFALPPSLDDELSVPKGKARLNFISFNGMSPVKHESVTRIRISHDNWIKISLPVIFRRPSEIARTEVKFDSGETTDLALIEDLSAVAEETFRQKAGFIYFKTIVRSIAKTTTSAVMDEASDQASGDAALLLGLLSLGTQIYAEASEQADLRMSRYFPSQALVGGINLAPGSYSFTVNYYDSANRLVQSRRFENVEVKAKKLNLVEAVCIK